MLALTRRTGQTLIFGDPKNPDVVLTVVSVKGDNVLLSIKAAPCVRVYREEIAERIKAGEPGGIKAGAIRNGAPQKRGANESGAT